MNRIALVLVLCLSSLAHAGDSRAWTAGKKVLPGKLFAVFGVNAGAIRSSDLYAKLLPMALDKAGDAKSHLQEIKDTCAIDVPAAIDSMVVGVDEDGKGTIVVALKGLAQKDVDACLGKLVKAHGGKLATEKAGDLVRYRMDAKDSDLYFRWLAKDVFAVATDPTDKAASVAATAGGLGSDKLMAPLIATSKTGAAMWFAISKTQDIAQLDAKMTGMYGNAELKSGDVALDGHLVLDADKAATDVATKATQMLPMLAASGRLPPSLTALVKSLVIKASGKEVVVTGQAPQQDMVDLVEQLGH